MTSLTTKYYLKDGTIFFLLVSFDLLTKYLFYDKWFFSWQYFFTPILNQGISFSFSVPLLVIIIASVLALWLFIYFYITQSFPRIALLFLIAGTLGNFYDRIVFEGVRDFIALPHLFIFNLADVFLFVAVLIIVISLYSKPNFDRS